MNLTYIYIAMLLDLHTHRPPSQPGRALVCNDPLSFVPQPGGCYSVGIHPWHVAEATEATWQALEEAASRSCVWAIGEAGLDKCTDAPLEQQLLAFRRQALLAESCRKPLILHVVKAVAELLQLKRQIRPAVPWIIHGFRGKAALAEQLLRHGFSLSFGEHYHEEALRCTPLHRLFLETDESLVPIEELYRRAASVRGMEADQLMAAIQDNLRTLFPHALSD